MVRAQFRVILGPSESFDPRGGMPVLLGVRAARELSVGDVAEQHVPERVLRVAANRRAALAPDEVPSLQRAQETVDVWGGDACRRCDTPQPEHLPCTAASCSSSFSGRGSASSRAAITPCTDSGSSAVLPRSDSMRTYCSAKSGFPAGPLEQRLPLVRELQRLRQQRRDEQAGVLVRQRLQRDRRRVWLAASPRLTVL